ncbi:MAG: DUF6456 domain-containing protein [Pseudomonadota bacterium]
MVRTLLHLAAHLPRTVQRGDTLVLPRRKISWEQIDALVRADLLRLDWGDDDSSPTLRITDAGRARLKRERARLRNKKSPRAATAGASLDPFQEQHRDMQMVRKPASSDEKVRQNLAESPLRWLATRKGPSGRPFISPEQLSAGERLHADYVLSGLSPNVTQSWSATGRVDVSRSERGLNASERSVAARARMQKALEMLGEDLSRIAWSVCCLEQGLTDAEGALGWPKRSAKLVLRIALDRLADHYGTRAGARIRTEHAGLKNQTD